ncbi:DUF1573 domain-containing protein [Rubinisphaera margarita]|uniref:DUF1573 domain-containing protein n=1 Tax=Rubinisphaera margarita TaxID=2909586 RepID=UPI001EE976F0|nr:DUF1573 domain-containing protein [Rubinisphaera margarita]MCG6154697.1 DUF1573 domain-containing protein [Rubinisphaera margarita]
MKTDLFCTSCCSLMVMTFFLAAIAGCTDDLSVSEETAKKADLSLPPGAPAPAVVIDEPVHDFGNMEVGQTLRHEFTIRNEGEGILKLVKDRSTCKCTMADFEEREVAPGESTSITLEWIGKVEDPAFSQAAFIKTNDPDIEEVSLTVTGRVDATWEITPAGVWNLGELSREKPTTFTGAISSRVKGDFELVKATSDSELVTVNIEPMTDEQLKEKLAKGGYLIEGEVAPGAPIGEFVADVRLDLIVEGEEEWTTFKLQGYHSGPVQILGPSGWQASNMLLVLGRFDRKEGKSVNLSMFVRDNNGAPINVTDVEAKPDFIEFEMTKDEKFQAENRERYEIRISVPPNSPSMNNDRVNSGKIIVTTDNKLVPKMIFNVHGLSY